MRISRLVLFLLVALPLFACTFDPGERTIGQISSVGSPLPAELTTDLRGDPVGATLDVQHTDTAHVAATVTATVPKPNIPAVTPLPAIGQRVAFEAEDGTSLLGEYFPAIQRPAPAIILMHQMGSNRRVWVRKGVVAWLNNSREEALIATAESAGALKWLPLPENTSFAVFIFDFRGHGESQGGSREMSDYLMDVRAAMAVVRGFPGVDPDRIALIGASIGADAAAGGCTDGCLGALSISPGGFLGTPYPQVVADLSQNGKKAWCLAASGDRDSARACAEADGQGYSRLVYSGKSAHGFDLLVPGLDPDITRVFRNFVFQVFGL